MLELSVPESELYVPSENMFIYTKPMTVRLEHSLISVSKWESHFKKPFLPSATQPGISTIPEEIHYIGCMSIGPLPDYLPTLIFNSFGKEIREYMGDPMSATIIHRPFDTDRGPKRTVTSELIYWWMIRFGVPFECEKWHLNRLLNLIDIANEQEKSAAKEKGSRLSTRDSAQYRNDLNKKRLAAIKAARDLEAQGGL